MDRADRTLSDVATAAAFDRAAYDHATARVADARRRLAAAQHHLDTAPGRKRRSLRHDVDIAHKRDPKHVWMDGVESGVLADRTDPAVGPLVPRTARTLDLPIRADTDGPILVRRDGQRLDTRLAAEVT